MFDVGLGGGVGFNVGRGGGEGFNVGFRGRCGGLMWVLGRGVGV